MKETLKKLAGKALPWTFWGSIGCSGLVVLMSIFLWLGAKYHLSSCKTDGFYAEDMAMRFVNETLEYIFPVVFFGFLAGLVALGFGFLSRQFKRPIIALSAIVASFIIACVAHETVRWSASSYDNALSAKPGYTETKRIESDLCEIDFNAYSNFMISRKAESMYRQIKNGISEVRNYNLETVRMICAGADSSAIQSRIQNAERQVYLLSQAVQDNHRGTSGNGGDDGGYNGGYNGGYDGGYNGGYNGGGYNGGYNGGY